MADWYLDEAVRWLREKMALIGPLVGAGDAIVGHDGMRCVALWRGVRCEVDPIQIHLVEHSRDAAADLLSVVYKHLGVAL